MSSPAIMSEQIDQLQYFINRVRVVQGAPLQRKDQKLKELEKSYRDLQYLFEKISAKDIAKNFSAQDAEVIQFLKLGEKNGQVFKSLTHLISDNPDAAALTLAKFIKSREGFEEINVKLSSANEKELKDVFETLFGVELAAQCVQAFRAEKVGSIIGYALSGLHDEHLKEWENDKRPQKQKGTKSQYLIEKIRESDVAFRYFKNDFNGLYGYNAGIDQLGIRYSSVRASETADHCFVNHKTKKIVIGSSTSTKNPEQQGQSYFDALEAAKCLVAQEFIGSEPNSYYGYEVEPFYFSTGYMVSNINREELKEGNKSTIGKVRGRDVINKTLKSSDQELADYAQSNFLSIAANGGHPKSYVSFLLHNLFLAGSDTEDCYRMSRRLKNMTNFQDQSIAAREFLCQKFTSALRVLNQSDLSQEYQSNAKTGRESFLLTAESVANVISGVSKMSSAPLSLQEYQSTVAPLLEQANMFFEKYHGKSQTENQIVDKIGFALISLDYGDGADQVLRRLNKQIAMTNVPADPSWVEIEHAKVVQYTTNATPDNLVPLVWLGKELLARIEGTGVMEEKFKTYLRTINSVLAGEELSSALSKYYPQYDDSRVNLSGYFKDFRKSLAGTRKEALRSFIKSTQFILSTKFNNGDFGASMRETAQEACDFYNQGRFNSLRGNIDNAVRHQTQEEHGPSVLVKKQYASRK